MYQYTFISLIKEVIVDITGRYLSMYTVAMTGLVGCTSLVLVSRERKHTVPDWVNVECVAKLIHFYAGFSCTSIEYMLAFFFLSFFLCFNRNIQYMCCQNSGYLLMI